MKEDKKKILIDSFDAAITTPLSEEDKDPFKKLFESFTEEELDITIQCMEDGTFLRFFEEDE